MLGSAADAEDVLQETWLRWVKADLAQVRDQRAYLIRITTRQALNRLRTLKQRKDDYVGPWQPEPLLTAPDVALDVLAPDVGALAFRVENTRITGLYYVRNPEKLTRVESETLLTSR